MRLLDRTSSLSLNLPLRPLATGSLLLASALALSDRARAQSIDVPLGPQDCYLHVHATDSAAPATSVALSALGALPGQSLLMAGFGDMDNGAAGDTILSLIGLFSSDATLLGPELVQRVPGAIDAGPEFLSSPTWTGAEPTDIPEDFRITSAIQPSAIVEIPVGAAYLFLGNHDSLWFDNTDPDSDLGCRLTVVGTWKDVGAGLAGTSGTPVLTGTGLLLGNDPVSITLSSARPGAPAFFVLGFNASNIPLFGGTLVPAPELLLGPFITSAAGEHVVAATWPAGLPDLVPLWSQAWILDPAAPAGVAASNGLVCLTP
ncbi:hypothetical protein [Engelhardtia mirabilis]|uniref:Uncharacterized protein n=1 Tax=Engelhardtia mirabilis TaxID=2528011 RepID=A0A518BGT7_9BACT|nr:hypothetical protein Pla133_12630 [Planctomycetes bacterium Pla133]QDV00524.1 hypothetical protein Pla86_12630 [Planctomycetes bacterium Pla86]